MMEELASTKLRFQEHRVLEGLRGEAFMVACDLGLDKLTQENGIKDLMDAIKTV